MPAAAQQDSIPSAPAVKFIIAGTRACDCRAKNVTTVPAAFGSITPTCSPRAGERRQFPPQHHAAKISRR